MSRCIGFPYCVAEIPEDDIACRRCWFKVPSRLRNEAKAVKSRFRNTVRYKEVMARFEQMLHKRLEIARRYNAKVEENRKRFTVVG